MNETMAKVDGKKLSRLLASKNITQKQAGEMFFTTGNVIQNAISRNRINKTLLMCICKEFEIKMEDLMLNETPSQGDQGDIDIKSLLSVLDRIDKKLLEICRVIGVIQTDGRIANCNNIEYNIQRILQNIAVELCAEKEPEKL